MLSLLKKNLCLSTELVLWRWVEDSNRLVGKQFVLPESLPELPEQFGKLRTAVLGKFDIEGNKLPALLAEYILDKPGNTVCIDRPVVGMDPYCRQQLVLNEAHSSNSIKKNPHYLI